MRPRQATSSAPQALVIEDSPAHRFIAEQLLAAQGFIVERATSLLEGEQRARALLEPGAAAAPTLILIDVMLPATQPLAAPSAGAPVSRIFEGTLLAARLIEEIEQGLLRPAHIAVISAELTPERSAEASLAGCCLALAKPLQPKAAAMLRQLIELPPAVTAPRASGAGQREPASAARAILRRSARQVFQALEQLASANPAGGPPPGARPVVDWSEEQIRLLLSNPLRLLQSEPWAAYFAGHGGVRAVLDLRQALRTTPLPEQYQQLLSLLLCQPTLHVGELAARLKLGRNTVGRRLKELSQLLAPVLNELTRSH